MNEFEKELKGYITGAERMSGFDSYDYNGAEGDMSSFDDDDIGMSAFDETSSATGSIMETMSEPYIIQYANSATTDANAVFLGFNDYSGATNYGTSTTITVTNLQGGSYGRLINQSNNKPFRVQKWRFQASGSNVSSQLAQTITIKGRVIDLAP